jgi:hypothetical protein
MYNEDCDLCWEPFRQNDRIFTRKTIVMDTEIYRRVHAECHSLLVTNCCGNDPAMMEFERSSIIDRLDPIDLNGG